MAQSSGDQPRSFGALGLRASVALDTAAPELLFGMAIGRVGRFLATMLASGLALAMTLGAIALV